MANAVSAVADDVQVKFSSINKERLGLFCLRWKLASTDDIWYIHLKMTLGTLYKDGIGYLH